jgi:hypothetical protein
LEEQLMKHLLTSSMAVAMAGILAGPAAAQIISTSVPKESSGGGSKSTSFHLMAGYTHWDFATLKSLSNFVEAQPNGVASGGKGGFIVAGDLAFQGQGSDLGLGLGGWYNKVSDYDISFSAPGGQFSGTDKFNLFSVYGSIFYKNIGVQAGVVHSSLDESTTFGDTITTSTSLNDVDAFLVYRKTVGGSDHKLTFALGAGIYRNSAQDPDPSVDFPGSDSKIVFSGFANASIGVVKGLSIDASFWYVGSDDQAYNLDTGTYTAKDDASRFTIGLGYTF